MGRADLEDQHGSGAGWKEEGDLQLEVLLLFFLRERDRIVERGWRGL